MMKTTPPCDDREPSQDDGARPEDRTHRDSLILALLTLCLLLVKVAVARYLMLGDGSVLRSLLLETPFLVAAIGLASSLPRRLRPWAIIGTDVVVTVWMVASVIFVSYFGQVPGPNDLRFAGQVGEVGDSVFDLIRPSHIFLFADLPVLIAVAISARLRRRLAGPHTRGPVVRRGLQAAGVLGALIACGLVVWASGLPEDVNSVPAAAGRGVFAFQTSQLLPKKDTAAGVTTAKASKEETSTPVQTRYATFPAGAAKGANLIIIQVEALQSALVGAKVDGVEIMPNLTQLSKECWYFPNTYTQISRGNTADAEYIVNTGTYAPPDQAASVRWGDRDVPSLPRLLEDSGYHTMTFHANTAEFWNRANMYAALGFDEYFDRSRLGWKPKWKWGTSDEVLFQKGATELKKLRSKETTFYAQFITLSSHYPYPYPPDSYRPYKPAAKWAKTKLGQYLSAESYSDKAIGEFIAELKKDGLWEDSVVVIYGDHFGFRTRDPVPASMDAQKQVFGATYTRNEYVGIPLFIHVPGGATPKRIDDAVGQVDILATVADPLGINLDRYTQFGRDAFVDGPALVGERSLVGAGSVINNRIIFVPGIGFDDGRAYSLSTGEEVKPTEQDRADYEEVRARMAASLEFSDALPKRKDAGKIPQGIIPNE